MSLEADIKALVESVELELYDTAVVSENGDKREEIINQLSEIVSFVDNLSELDTKNVDDKFAMNDSSTFLREDVASCDKQINDDILSHAPNSADHFFIVPKIIE